MAFFFYAFQGTSLLAQSDLISVRGSVVDNGEPVVGATVMVKGLFTGTATDIDGNFSLNVSPTGTLVVSYIGYETVEIPINGRKFINVELRADVVTLDDIVVVGYGTQRKVNLTGAVSSVSTKSWREINFQCAGGTARYHTRTNHPTRVINTGELAFNQHSWLEYNE